MSLSIVSGQTGYALPCAGSAPDLTLALTGIPDQLSLAPAALVAVAGGGTPGYSYSWTVNGSTAGIATPTAASTSYTPTEGEAATAVCTVTDSALKTKTAAVSWTIGDSDTRVQSHFVDWTAAANAGAYMGSTTTKDGIALTFSFAGGGGGSTWTAATGVGLVGVVAGGASSIAVDWSGADLGSTALTAQKDVVWYTALSSVTLGGTDLFNLWFLDALGSDRVGVAIRYSAGYLASARQRRSGIYSELDKPVGSVPTILALRFEAGVIAEARYSLAAWSGTFPAFSSLTPVYTTRSSNMFTVMDLTSADTADRPPILGSLGRYSANYGVTVLAQEIRFRSV